MTEDAITPIEAYQQASTLQIHSTCDRSAPAGPNATTATTAAQHGATMGADKHHDLGVADRTEAEVPAQKRSQGVRSSAGEILVAGAGSDSEQTAQRLRHDHGRVQPGQNLRGISNFPAWMTHCKAASVGSDVEERMNAAPLGRVAKAATVNGNDIEKSGGRASSSGTLPAFKLSTSAETRKLNMVPTFPRR